MLIDVSKEPTVLNLKIRREREKARADILGSTEPLLAVIGDACQRRFSDRRRLSERDLEDISQVILKDFDASVKSFIAFDQRRAPTRVRPKGDAIEHFRMFIGPDFREGEGKASVWALHLYATRKLAVVDFRRHPSTWKAHVSVRMHERLEASLDAEREVAQALVLEQFIISAATDAVQEANLPNRIAIPCRGGLLLGQIEMLPPDDGGSFRWNVTRQGSRQLNMPNRYIFRDNYPRHIPTWTAQTFIGPNEMRPRQDDYAARFTEIRNRFKRAADLTVELQTVGGSVLKPHSTPAESRAIYEEIRSAYEEAKQALKVFLSIPRFSIAAGNDWDGFEFDQGEVAEQEMPAPALAM